MVPTTADLFTHKTHASLKERMLYKSHQNRRNSYKPGKKCGQAQKEKKERHGRNQTKQRRGRQTRPIKERTDEPSLELTAEWFVATPVLLRRSSCRTRASSRRHSGRVLPKCHQGGHGHPPPPHASLTRALAARGRPVAPTARATEQRTSSLGRHGTAEFSRGEGDSALFPSPSPLGTADRALL